MILSVSRRTDVPRFYFDWFLNRLKEGYCMVRNPMNFRQVSKIRLSPEIVDCIVFWTKEPSPMIGRLAQLKSYPYYIQFTINPYAADMESNLPERAQRMDTFRRLSDKIGPQRVVWRYSPVLLNETYTEEYHLNAFARLARELQGYTQQCKLSFVDLYAKIRKTMDSLGVRNIKEEQKNRMARTFFDIAAREGIAVSACGNIDLVKAGIPPAKCIDDRLISRITGCRYHLKKDSGQREDCSCVKSVDIGAYDTCLNGCRYCYANVSMECARQNMQAYDPLSPLLCSELSPQDKVSERALKSDRQEQMKLF